MRGLCPAGMGTCRPWCTPCDRKMSIEKFKPHSLGLKFTCVTPSNTVGWAVILAGMQVQKILITIFMKSDDEQFAWDLNVWGG